MPDNRRVWTEDDIAKLKDIAGRIPREEIAAQLGRTVGATAVRPPNWACRYVAGHLK